ncbi:Trp biosynthesis-associated membrane protein [Nocardioides sp.]|uniref:Trp biosynthesis-associated membrane protein n=1 Tax=Nocardioides sp. TaxID=35761 RepID=UPI002B858548|nr:Trp biosynthesis-associated membrane protein [Nocardioides sp.]HXH78856.1 Trp biosynthesis-associated membrane protein [Nocardioides sp.]
MAERSRTFGPVLLFGLASGVLAAVAGARPWVTGSSGNIDTSTTRGAATIDLSGVRESPLAGALALVVLACWGVILVTRGRVRRAVAALAAVASLGLLVTTVLAIRSLQDALSEALLAASGVDNAVLGITGWYPAALVAAVISLVSTVAAVRYLPTWPEMGSRYDAPAGDSPTEVEPEGNLELWKALDEGHDPTASERPLD